MNDEQVNRDANARKRRRTRKRKPVYGLLPRFTVIGIVVLIGVAIITGLVGKAVEPFARASNQSGKIQMLQAQVNETVSENAKLEARKQSLSRPEGIEVAARSEGYLRKGEVRLVLENDPTPVAQPKDESPLQRIRSAWMNFITR
ncbi:MAG TPA: hypothetical protein VGK19_09185 [Capsulimonadaceae bacterium]|jgi:cell division protein FtsB